MYTVELTRTARKAHLKLPQKIRAAVHKKLWLLANDPQGSHNNVKKLYVVEDAYRLRVQDWRVLYRLEHKIMVIEVIKIAHRRKVYK